MSLTVILVEWQYLHMWIKIFRFTGMLSTKATVLAVLMVFFMLSVLAAKTDLPVATTPIRLAVLLTPDHGSETFLHIFEAGSRLFPAPVAKFQHLPNAGIKGAVMSDGSVLVVADYEPGRDRSFGSALFRLEPGVEPVFLCDHVVYASKPLITSDGRVFVARGTAGLETKDVMRVDSLSIDEVDMRTGAIRTLRRSTGYIAYLAGAFGNDIIIYDLKPSGASLTLVDINTQEERIILPSMPAHASDFSATKTGKLVFQNSDPRQSDFWFIESLDLATGKLERLQKLRESVGPRGWPRGEVTWNSPEGLRSSGSSLSAKAPQGIVNIQAFSTDGTVAAAVVFPPEKSDPYIALVDPAGAELSRISPPSNTPFVAIGFVP